MTRQSRLQEYANPTRPENWNGESTKEYIGRWSERAHAESDGHKHRAKSGAMELPDTAQAPQAARPRFIADPRAEAKADKNFSGSDSYMPGTRRTA
jgi:hypothetical protein